jgi:O-antigen/teichoic acid export membrane protein
MVLFIPQVAIQIYTVLDKTMIGSLLDDMSQVGYYEQVQKIVKVSLTVVTSMGVAMLPRIANCFATNDKKKIKEYINKAFRFSLCVSIPMAFGMMAVASKFVPSFFGEEFYPAVPLMKIMCLITVFISLSNVIGVQYLLPTKKEKYYTISVIIGAVVNFILNYFLIKCYKSLGATIATVIAEFLVTAIQFYFVRKEFKLLDVIKMSKNYFIAGLVMFLVVSYLNTTEVFIRSVTIVLETGIGCIIYILMLYLLKDDFFIETYKSVKKMIFNK